MSTTQVIDYRTVEREHSQEMFHLAMGMVKAIKNGDDGLSLYRKSGTRERVDYAINSRLLEMVDGDVRITKYGEQMLEVYAQFDQSHRMAAKA